MTRDAQETQYVEYEGRRWAKQPDKSVWRWDPDGQGWEEWRPKAPGPLPPDEWIRNYAKERKQALRDVTEDQRTKEEAESRFFVSPVGQARVARGNGQKYFELILPVEETVRSVWAGDQPMFGSPMMTRAKRAGQTHVIEEIEAEGWELLKAQYVFQPTGSMSRDRFLATGQVEQVLGRIVGVYLFRSLQGEGSP